MGPADLLGRRSRPLTRRNRAPRRGAVAEVGARGVSYYIGDAEVHPPARTPGATDGDAVPAAVGSWSPTRWPTRVRTVLDASCGGVPIEPASEVIRQALRARLHVA